MNIAFTSILIFILLAPGFLYLIAYNSSKLSIRDPNKTILKDLTWSIIPSLTIHIIAISLIEWQTEFRVNFQLLGNLILGVTSENKVETSFRLLREFMYPIFWYNLFVFSFSFFAGYGIQKLVRKCRLDRRIRYLRFSNKWHYIFSGECLDFPDVPDHYEEITDKVINILCKVNGKAVLYTGEYFNYYIDKNGDLEAVHLKHPIRRYLDEDDEHNPYYEIESRYLAIPNSDIININFRYFNLEEIDEASLSPEEINNAITIDR